MKVFLKHHFQWNQIENIVVHNQNFGRTRALFSRRRRCSRVYPARTFFLVLIFTLYKLSFELHTYLLKAKSVLLFLRLLIYQQGIKSLFISIIVLVFTVVISLEEDYFSLSYPSCLISFLLHLHWFSATFRTSCPLEPYQKFSEISETTA